MKQPPSSGDGRAVPVSRAYQVCTRCVMDTSDPDIGFDAEGVCNHCRTHEERHTLAPVGRGDAGQRLDALVQSIRQSRRGDYDSIVGLSGGVDSSYVAYQAVRLGLKPLAVHFDNGWNSEQSVRNIERVVKSLGLDLQTFVIDWPEFRDIQRSFFKADVIDIEMVTDQAIFGSIYRLARKHGIRTILSGTNVQTESIMPRAWQHFKFDARNLKAIHRRFGTLPIRRYPVIGLWAMAFNQYVSGCKSVSLLNYIDYRKSEAMRCLQDELGWQYYGGKHYESVFTRFYQAHILPYKFGVDKRRCHMSDLIMNGELSRADAQTSLAGPLYEPEQLRRDTEYVCKKLGFSAAEFEDYMTRSPVSHFAYPSDARLGNFLSQIHRQIRYRRT